MGAQSRSLLLAAIALAFAGCEPAADDVATGAAEDTTTGAAAEYTAPPSTVDTQAEAQAIMALEREWSARFAADDVDWIVDLHAANARQLPPNAEAVVGAEALRATWEGMATTEGFSATWESSEVHVSDAGDMAYDLGTGTITTPDGQATPFKYVVVWVKENGEWKVAVDIFSPNS
jgi:ketosteroid isomerase-like protein